MRLHRLCPCLVGISLAALHVGCADVLGADFDVHAACETCDAGPVVLAEGLDHPKSVAVGKDGNGLNQIPGDRDQPTGLVSDGERLYWGELGAGAIMRGEMFATPEVLADGQSGPNGLAIDGDTLYWANYVAQGTIVKMKLP